MFPGLIKKTTIIIIQIKKNYTKQKLLILKCLSVGPLRTLPNLKKKKKIKSLNQLCTRIKSGKENLILQK